MWLFGAYAMNSLRLEKAYRGMGSELTAQITLVEADMERLVGWDKEDFTGKAATLRSRQQGPRIQLVYLTVDAADADCIGNEPVFAGDTVTGVTTSGGYGFATGRSIAFAYVDPVHAAPGTALEIEVLGRRLGARVVEQPLYDPENARLRS